MNVLLIQSEISWQDPEANRKHAAELIDASPAADLIILPEMFTTGFVTSPKGVAEQAGTVTLAWMRETARRKQSALAGSVATEDAGRYYNRFYFVKPDGSYTTYDKRHRFSFAGEDKEYTAGTERVIVEHGGFRILLQVCYDLRFPVFSRNRGDYDMAIYVASWPTPRVEAWNALLRARAIENVCYVAAVNRVGTDPNCAYSGGTVLLDYLGQPVVAAEFGKEEAVCGAIDRERLTGFRQKFPALQDADRFTIDS